MRSTPHAEGAQAHPLNLAKPLRRQRSQTLDQAVQHLYIPLLIIPLRRGGVSRTPSIRELLAACGARRASTALRQDQNAPETRCARFLRRSP